MNNRTVPGVDPTFPTNPTKGGDLPDLDSPDRYSQEAKEQIEGLLKREKQLIHSLRQRDEAIVKYKMICDKAAAAIYHASVSVENATWMIRSEMWMDLNSIERNGAADAIAALLEAEADELQSMFVEKFIFNEPPLSDGEAGK